MTHLQERLAERNLAYRPEALTKIARHFGNTSAAVLLARLDNHQGVEGAYRSRQESNGDLVILICRNGEAKTIMYRRSNQPITPEALNVRHVVELEYTQ